MGRFRFSGNRAVGAFRSGDFASLVNGDYIIIGSKKYEFRTSGSATAGNVQVNVGASDALTITAFMAAVNANKPTVPVTAVVDPIDPKVARITADSRGAAGNIVFTASLTGAANVISGSGLLQYGESAAEQVLHRGSYVVTAIDVSATSIVIETGLTSPVHATIESYTSTGAKKTSTALKTISGTKILVDFTGATDHVAGDVIEWSAWE